MSPVVSSRRGARSGLAGTHDGANHEDWQRQPRGRVEPPVSAVGAEHIGHLGCSRPPPSCRVGSRRGANSAGLSFEDSMCMWASMNPRTIHRPAAVVRSRRQTRRSPRYGCHATATSPDNHSLVKAPNTPRPRHQVVLDVAAGDGDHPARGLRPFNGRASFGASSFTSSPWAPASSVGDDGVAERARAHRARALDHQLVRPASLSDRPPASAAAARPRRGVDRERRGQLGGRDGHGLSLDPPIPRCLSTAHRSSRLRFRQVVWRTGTRRSAAPGGGAYQVEKRS